VSEEHYREKRQHVASKILVERKQTQWAKKGRKRERRKKRLSIGTHRALRVICLSRKL